MSKKKHKRCLHCAKWEKAAAEVANKYGAMGFRHNPDRAKGAEDVLNAMGKTAHNPDPHTLVSVAVLMPVQES